jgi:2-polyprenyl-3-methyl-5-hydroxy-6-metoxy-1,4-benzoquinol methylase
MGCYQQLAGEHNAAEGSGMTKYQCSVCKLEFTNPELARQCEQWCAAHDSCNLEIGRKAINRDSAGCCDQRFPRDSKKSWESNVQAVAYNELRDKVREAYSSAAVTPADKHPFPVGRAFAESLGYPAPLLDSLPLIAVEAFAGVSNVSLFATIAEGAKVLDLGCGAGLDSLIAARRAAPSGRVIGVDFSTPMLDRARQAAKEAAIQNVSFEQAEAERLPLDDACIDVALVNGIFNLNPARTAIFGELARVVRRDGVVYAAELILAGFPPANQSDADWFA